MKYEMPKTSDPNFPEKLHLYQLGRNENLGRQSSYEQLLKMYEAAAGMHNKGNEHGASMLLGEIEQNAANRQAYLSSKSESAEMQKIEGLAAIVRKALEGKWVATT